MGSPTVHDTHLDSLEKIHQGKVRDLYAIDAETLLIVTTDRLSAFDVVLPDAIPEKGRVLNRISCDWFERTRHIVPNHLTGRPVESVVRGARDLEVVASRSVVARRLQALPLEAVVRGYLIGSGWKAYERTGAVCGIELPAGLLIAQQLPEPIFTPTTKAPAGAHDEGLTFAGVEALIGPRLAAEVRDTALELYRFAVRRAMERGIIIADTKFEFGVDRDGRLVLIDEVLTPDSSRFWPLDTYRAGVSPPSFDKQFVRDYLETLDWNKQPPAPSLPQDVIDKTAEKYREAYRRLTE